MSAILFSRNIGPVPIACVIRENPSHELGISKIPIESGAAITDHAYIEPKRLRMEIADGAAAGTFNALVAFQESRVPFTVVSGLFVYSNMLIQRLEADRDAEWSTALRGLVELQEAIIVETAYAAAESGDAMSDGQPGGKDSTRSASPSKGRSGDAATADRASGTVMRGDAPTSTVSPSSAPTGQSQSILKSMF